MKLDRNFYNRDTLVVAKELLGKILVHKINGKLLSGMIVETEAYLGVNDKAAHAYGGRRTKRVETMYGPPGRAYVYIIYGMYNCLNTITREEGVPQGVLIRGIEPIEGLDYMALNRFNKPLEELTKNQIKNLTNGPGKLCQAMMIDRSLDKEDLCGERLYIEKGIDRNFDIVEAKRIGIDYAEEARDFLYRFYIEGNPNVSKFK
ncbi:DNA-3-methyladenine glycosylase [Anaerosalibacter bizertensis]|uniref:Putative 3-methyladenine DNA glycosylase n=1 Tax=Anaerosalibacter bizertensis TaxID=932217 RepID=A0A844FFK2_9FIRM|nr:DNA-3-methyladenine glycosylase [Anaerosalibacter bizertensis]MBV1817243.1 DNA-3-methyladenine glycosylase [Bacteroidales bacterium MSK.15.36]HHV26294.1 DNA-3-methyladenine glycosylase [Tissierellia bacterium]MBU5293585.1 DNA-3-methyladenine glycosylase [Anaerosalibacter bizertensis]MCG4564354.1 DNA-3-methyladenine glycosylase [Anaerosalibacter bizertensis]MCG4583208.1 DNA-3-methyladenine glycosylase [Anaerosalibacter bizertensis]